MNKSGVSDAVLVINYDSSQGMFNIWPYDVQHLGGALPWYTLGCMDFPFLGLSEVPHISYPR